MANEPSDRFPGIGDAELSPPKGRSRGSRELRLDDRVVIAHGMPTRFWQDLYHRALVVRWPMFFVSLAVLFVLLNTTFAALYMLGDAPIANQYPPGFNGAFFFSVETLATVGYGDMHPQTIYAHWIATLEIFVGMSGIALATGLIFARFSRPHAKIMFARYAIVRPLDGHMTLMVRSANGRQNVIAEAHARLRILRRETTAEGYTLRRLHDLRLLRDQHPVFKLGWSLMHVIDENSPLFGETAETLKARDTSLLLTLEGVDESTSQTMHARHMWTCDQIYWQHRFVDIMSERDGVSHIDYSHFHEIVPLDEAPVTDSVPNAHMAQTAR
ncbi:ion channel [Paraburkholderia rhynchosiae]|uniref:Inward rectifier potassium channel n=1 Tax=Paraburkholderia rhynchosiae TaxID=487049 RepID=A0A2N7WPV3_9BURK|nr:ion channel [Paraburkholderia rhynchosiae]PMS31453.1 Inward rectifier potassium channel [Paraburkholderia rhynchosiae]CAB3661624.1 Inward rectifier potassium channel Kirbac3.1 [Paraburkholderia rhynchosiae]